LSFVSVHLIPVVVAVFAIVSAAAWAVYVGRSRAEQSARSALTDELQAWRSAADRIGKEKDAEAEGRRAAEAQVKVLEARTDLSALSEQIAATTEASTRAIIHTLEEHDKRSVADREQATARADERHRKMMADLEEQHRQVITLIGSMSAMLTRQGGER